LLFICFCYFEINIVALGHVYNINTQLFFIPKTKFDGAYPKRAS